MEPDPKDDAPEPQLPERKFVSENYSSDPGTLWIWLAFSAAFLAIIWGIGSQYAGYFQGKDFEKPFLQVSNRDISVFLWQNPEFMRANVKGVSKTSYMPAFEYIGGSVAVNPRAADQWVQAPPEVLFRYHTWDRLLRDEYIARPIAVHEFIEFIEYDEQWQPENWPAAPAGYKELVKGLDPLSKDDMQRLPETTFPLVVRLAFEGWKNFRYEGEKIDAVRPTMKDMTAFLNRYPHYERSYWRNIVDTTLHEYLKSLTREASTTDAVIPVDELAAFVKAAFYNSLQAQKGQ